MKFLENQWSEVTTEGKSPAGIRRGDLEGIDEYFSVQLWNDYRKNHKQKPLKTLLAYNIPNMVNLEYLLILSYNFKLRESPFAQSR
jgi:uncharacterized protein YprB with RNaseH-like and TPR domain